MATSQSALADTFQVLLEGPTLFYESVRLFWEQQLADEDQSLGVSIKKTLAFAANVVSRAISRLGGLIKVKFLDLLQFLKTLPSRALTNAREIPSKVLSTVSSLPGMVCSMVTSALEAEDINETLLSERNDPEQDFRGRLTKTRQLRLPRVIVRFALLLTSISTSRRFVFPASLSTAELLDAQGNLVRRPVLHLRLPRLLMWLLRLPRRVAQDLAHLLFQSVQLIRENPFSAASWVLSILRSSSLLPVPLSLLISALLAVNSARPYLRLFKRSIDAFLFHFMVTGRMTVDGSQPANAMLLQGFSGRLLLQFAQSSEPSYYLGPSTTSPNSLVSRCEGPLTSLNGSASYTSFVRFQRENTPLADHYCYPGHYILPFNEDIPAAEFEASTASTAPVSRALVPGNVSRDYLLPTLVLTFPSTSPWHPFRLSLSGQFRPSTTSEYLPLSRSQRLDLLSLALSMAFATCGTSHGLFKISLLVPSERILLWNAFSLLEPESVSREIGTYLCASVLSEAVLLGLTTISTLSTAISYLLALLMLVVVASAL